MYTERKNCRKAGQDMKKTVITIARSYGSGGKTLGNLLAKDLGINCYSREILRMASDESGINEALFGEVDEKMKKSPLLFNILKKNPYKGGVLPPESSDFVSCRTGVMHYHWPLCRLCFKGQSGCDPFIFLRTVGGLYQACR